MVNIAQRGRSLGMHVLLATQRPAGVVTGNIRANTDLRIALRVSSKDDSQRRASTAPTPPTSRAARPAGRGSGAPATAPPSSCSRPGPARASRSPAASRPVEVSPVHRAAGPRARPGQRRRPASTRAPTSSAASPPSTAPSRAAGAAAPARPWLPPLPAELLLDAAADRRRRAEPLAGRVVIGRIDEPAAQRQPDARRSTSPPSGHLLVLRRLGLGQDRAAAHRGPRRRRSADAFGARGRRAVRLRHRLRRWRPDRGRRPADGGGGRAREPTRAGCCG